MRSSSPVFLAWQEAEHRAVEAERRLFAKLCDRNTVAFPSPQEMTEARMLRENASRRMQQMLDEMAALAAALKCSHEEPVAPVPGVGTRRGELARHPAR